mmetsp:Transcript_79294/g.116215  ORF Transcript_79294/g.116215 Transcript_79294/m.116215 type:complete len:210 (+) Transcript_79294:2105-2734(+)
MVICAHLWHAVERLGTSRQLREPLLPRPGRRHFVHLLPRSLFGMLFVCSGAIDEDAGKLALVLDHQLSLALGVGAIDQLEKVADTLLELVDVRHHLGIFCLREVGRIWERRVSLSQEEGVLRVVVRIRINVPREEHVHIGLIKLNDDVEERLVILDGVNQVQPRHDRLSTLGFDAITIHTCLVIFARAAVILLKHRDHLILDVELSPVP